MAHAFAGDHESAAAWLRADRKGRREFWSPQKLRTRADGAFIDEHFWSHCERGGHPTMEGSALLPDHSMRIDGSILWVDLAGHLASIWRHVLAAAELACGRPIPALECKLPNVQAALEVWHSTDALYAFMQDLGAALRGPEPDVS